MSIYYWGLFTDGGNLVFKDILIVFDVMRRILIKEGTEFNKGRAM